MQSRTEGNYRILLIGVLTLLILTILTNIMTITYPGSPVIGGREAVLLKSPASHHKRKLSLQFDPVTGDSVVTYDGDVPETQCPIGKYRMAGSTDLQMVRGQRTDGCVYCPRGC